MPLLIGLNVDRQMQVFADVFLLKIYGMYLFYCIIISVKIMFDCTGILCLSLKQCCGAGAGRSRGFLAGAGADLNLIGSRR